jgi:transcriptional regulator with XRE-family HTH domain
MAKTRSRLEQPGGDRISVGPEMRAWFKTQREAKKLGQGTVGKKVGLSQGSISNLENGTHPQITKAAYAKLLRLFGTPDAPDGADLGGETDALFGELVKQATPLTESDMRLAVALVRQLREAREKSEK